MLVLNLSLLLKPPIDCSKVELKLDFARFEVSHFVTACSEQLLRTWIQFPLRAEGEPEGSQVAGRKHIQVGVRQQRAYSALTDAHRISNNFGPESLAILVYWLVFCS